MRGAAILQQKAGTRVAWNTGTSNKGYLPYFIRFYYDIALTEGQATATVVLPEHYDELKVCFKRGDERSDLNPDINSTCSYKSPFSSFLRQ